MEMSLLPVREVMDNEKDNSDHKFELNSDQNWLIEASYKTWHEMTNEVHVEDAIKWWSEAKNKITSWQKLLYDKLRNSE